MKAPRRKLSDEYPNGLKFPQLKWPKPEEMVVGGSMGGGLTLFPKGGPTIFAPFLEDVTLLGAMKAARERKKAAKGPPPPPPPA